ncbi:MAG TPA: hypothetical protein VFN53_02765 [Acidobacteriaceae bacterium]|nr:hypothetical protein [Acidobacteriaceae bacterium]
MKQTSIWYFVAILGLVSVCQPAKAQNSVAVFGPVDVRLAPGNTTGQPNKNSPPVAFNTSTLNLTCPSVPQAVLTSSPSTGTTNANLLVDNYINLTVTPGGIGTAIGSPVDICGGGTSDTGTDHSQECYVSGFSSAVPNLVGLDLDKLVGTYGVPALNISSYLVAGPQLATFDLVDLGDYVASSSLYLNTNCKQTGVSGQVNLTGNVISAATNLTQNYPIDSTLTQKFQFVYDLSKAQSAGTLSISAGTIPYVTDNALNPADFQTMVAGTSFATSSCLIHNGELIDGIAVCSVYTLECTSGSSTTPSGAQCPVSSLPNELFNDIFDGPSPVLSPQGHQGIGLLMASEDWTGSPCTFDPASGLQDLPCPQNLITSFSGPGLFTLLSSTSHPNSTFIAVAGVPEDLTTVTLQNQHPGNWVNTRSLSVTLSSVPPVVPAPTSFIPSPIQSITYGIAQAGSIQPTPAQPASGDVTVTNVVTCPQQATVGEAVGFATPSQTLTVPADGNYLLHYYAQDCAGTKEYQFTNTAGSWSTSYYTYSINVDTVAPIVNSGPTLSPAANTLILGDYIQGQSVTASYSCTDERSGVVTCGGPGALLISPPTLSTGTLTSNVPTSTASLTGTAQTYTVHAVDAAGNQSSTSVNYTVIAYDTGIQITQKGTRVDVSISPISGHPATGSVELYLGITPYQSAKLTGGGVAHFDVGVTGTYSVSAVYAGSLSAPITLTF